jgi:hypothetical protein
LTWHKDTTLACTWFNSNPASHSASILQLYPINEGCWKMNTTILIVLHNTIFIVVSTLGKPISWSKYLFSNLCRGKSIIPLIMSCQNRTSWRNGCCCLVFHDWGRTNVSICKAQHGWANSPRQASKTKHKLPSHCQEFYSRDIVLEGIIVVQLTCSATICIHIVHDFLGIGWKASLELINIRDGKRLTWGTLHLSWVLTLYHVEYFEVHHGIEHLNTPQINAIQINQLPSSQHSIWNKQTQNEAKKKQVQLSHNY